MPQIVLDCDDDDYRDLQAEIARQQAAAHQLKDRDGNPCYPEGTSNVAAVSLAEAVRSLWEYRALWESEHA